MAAHQKLFLAGLKGAHVVLILTMKRWQCWMPECHRTPNWISDTQATTRVLLSVFCGSGWDLQQSGTIFLERMDWWNQYCTHFACMLATAALWVLAYESPKPGSNMLVFRQCLCCLGSHMCSHAQCADRTTEKVYSWKPGAMAWLFPEEKVVCPSKMKVGLLVWLWISEGIIYERA